MKVLPVLVALALAGVMLWSVIPGPVPSAPADPALSTPKPTPRACAGRVTNNPAILEWRRSLGCH